MTLTTLMNLMIHFMTGRRRKEEDEDDNNIIVIINGTRLLTIIVLPLNSRRRRLTIVVHRPTLPTYVITLPRPPHRPTKMIRGPNHPDMAIGMSISIPVPTEMSTTPS